MIYDVAILISLERREDRANQVKEHLKKRGIKNLYTFPAYDGKLIPEWVSIKPPHRSYFSWNKLNQYQIACTLSHVGAMKMAKGLGAKRALIFEDDAILCKDFTKRLEIFEEESLEINLDWDHVYFGGVPKGKTTQVTDHIYESQFTDGLHAYLVSEDGMKKVSDEMLKFNTTNDDAVNDLLTKKELNSYIFLPLSSYQKADFSELDQKFSFRKEMLKYYKEEL
ncbi:MAG: glycosyltransferase family 25 protein [bacterium]